MTKKQQIYKGFVDSGQSEFDHHYACWALNHMGWAKAKKTNKRIAKKRERAEMKKEIELEINHERPD